MLWSSGEKTVIEYSKPKKSIALEIAPNMQEDMDVFEIEENKTYSLQCKDDLFCHILIKSLSDRERKRDIHQIP